MEAEEDASHWKMFILSDGKGKSVTTELVQPLDEEISGIVEVVGRVTTKATIMCASYIQCKEDNHPFDLGLYNITKLWKLPMSSLSVFLWALCSIVESDKFYDCK